MLQNARQSVYWHGITRDVESMCQRCHKCQNIRNSTQKEPLIGEKVPERPFDVVASDLFYSGGKVFMIFSDRLSGFPMVESWPKDPTTQQVKRVLMYYFSMFGKPLNSNPMVGHSLPAKKCSNF